MIVVAGGIATIGLLLNSPAVIIGAMLISPLMGPIVSSGMASAILSSAAGGYAMIRGRGGAIVGVAIATALMPPLATIGYGLVTENWPVARCCFSLPTWWPSASMLST